MKKMLTAGFMTLALLAAVQQQAQAWCKFNFGVGLNWNYEGGGNSALWGLVRGSPMPGTNCPDEGFADGHSKGGLFGHHRKNKQDACLGGFPSFEGSYELPAEAPRHGPVSPDKQEREKVPMPSTV